MQSTFSLLVQMDAAAKSPACMLMRSHAQQLAPHGRGRRGYMLQSCVLRLNYGQRFQEALLLVLGRRPGSCGLLGRRGGLNRCLAGQCCCLRNVSACEPQQIAARLRQSPGPDRG